MSMPSSMPPISSSSLHIEEGKVLAPFSTFGIGGPARYFIAVKTIGEMEQAFRFAHEKSLPFYLLGKGSNLLIDDRGFSGVVILNQINHYSLEGNHVKVGAGYSFALLGVRTAKAGLSGLEFASGIPASVGGAIFMNAGANHGEVKDCLTSVTYIHPTGRLEVFPIESLSFDYRSSPFQMMQGAIVEATFELIPSTNAKSNQLDIVDYRKRTQPYGEKSAGCVFRNPGGELSAGALIEKSGLKGMRIGGAEVSPRHANFVVNKGGATAEDVLTLLSKIVKTVKEKHGVELEREVRLLPYEF